MFILFVLWRRLSFEIHKIHLLRDVEYAATFMFLHVVAMNITFPKELWTILGGKLLFGERDVVIEKRMHVNSQDLDAPLWTSAYSW